MHIFDAEKVEGGISVRLSKRGEKIETLDGKEIEFDSPILIIADDKGPLAIAGIKGGNRAEINKGTKKIIVESANFNSSSIRNNSKIIDLKTSASKRFESNITPQLATEAMDYFCHLLSLENKGVKFGEVVDIYLQKAEKTTIEFTKSDIDNSLGVDLKDEEIKNILEKLNFVVILGKKGIKVEVPYERTDIKIKEDLVEEIGRIYGYENINNQQITALRGKAMIAKDFYYTEKIKNLLNNLGFDEVSLYSLTSKGFFEIAYPLADDKKFLREDLSTGLIECISRNYQNLPVLGLRAVKIFEIGRVFGKNGERVHVCIGCKSLAGKNSKKNDEEAIQKVLADISSSLQVNFPFKISSNEKGSVVEFDITESFVFSKSPDSYFDLNFDLNSNNVFKPFSPYPFVLRDLALFVPANTVQNEIESLIKENCGDLLVRFDLFDVFNKKNEDGSEKISYAYHLVFQSESKTLTDIEINDIMNRLYNNLNTKSGWQVR
jgi:phenylalanyl-tRNA synthetase beta chain